MSTLTVARSKPDLVKALRATWRKSAQHTAEQLARFVRLTVMAAVPSVVDLIAKGPKHFDWYTLLMVIVPFGETAWRQVFPALGAAKVDEAPGATIVPEQVGAAAAPVPEPDVDVDVPADVDPAAPEFDSAPDGPLMTLTGVVPPAEKVAAKRTVAKKAAAKKTAPRKVAKKAAPPKP